MLLPNTKVVVKSIEGQTAQLETEAQELMTVPLSLLPQASVGQHFYLAADLQPLVSGEQSAKDIVNEIIGQ